MLIGYLGYLHLHLALLALLALLFEALKAAFLKSNLKTEAASIYQPPPFYFAFCPQKFDRTPGEPLSVIFF